MSVIENRRLVFALMDEHDLVYYVEGGVVKKRSLPTLLNTNPDKEKDIVLQFATNERWFATIRDFTNAIDFPDDGKTIILDRAIKGKGTEEIMYMAILKSDPSLGLNAFRLEYKSRLDFSKFNGHATDQIISMNTLQDDVFSMLQANESTNYAVQCNSSNPAAIKILFDGLLMQDKLNYETINAPIQLAGGNGWMSIPLVFINNEGDSVGATFKDQNFDSNNNPDPYITNPAQANYILKFQQATTVHIKGTFAFTWHNDVPGFVGTHIWFLTSTSQVSTPQHGIYRIYDDFVGTDVASKPLVTVPIDLVINLAADEKLFFICNIAGSSSNHTRIVPEITDIHFSFSTKQVPSTAYALRPLDYLQQTVSLITKGRFTADSNYFRNHNQKVILSGSSARSFPDAVINSSIGNWFKAFDLPYFLSMKVTNGVLWVEPVADMFGNDTEILNLAEVSKASLSVAESKIYTAIEIGYGKNTYNKRNGRYDYNNGKHTYKMPINATVNKLELLSPWRSDPFGLEYIRTGYPNLNSTDDKGDNDIWTVMISDSVGQTTGTVRNAVTFTVETLILATPIIKSPYNGAVVYNAHPTIEGVSQPDKIITVYVDGAQDGQTVADANGFWSYQVNANLRSRSIVFNGIHTFEVNAQVDPTNISGTSRALSLIIDTGITAPFLITAPTNNDTLYNNLPIIKGIAPAGASIRIYVDGFFIGEKLTNSSGLWSLQTTVPLVDNTHVVTVTSPGLTALNTVNFSVNKNVSTPLVTSISYGDIIYDSLPLIKGVAQAGVTVTLYLDGGGGAIVGGIAGPMGTTVADANGDWQFQVVRVYDSGGFARDYIPDGLHVIATTRMPIDVLSAISGFRLMRGTDRGPIMDYDSIRLDDEYIPAGVDPATLPGTLGVFNHPETLYNIIDTTPLECLLRHSGQIAGSIWNQPDESILFNGSESNPNLTRRKNGTTLSENQNIKVKALSRAIWHPWIMNFTTMVDESFNRMLTALNKYGYVSTTVKGVPIYLLPIGKMQMKPATDEPQQWSLLVSSKTPLLNLIKIFTNGTTLNIGKNMVRFSDYNPLHIVQYNYTPDPSYHWVGMYQDWQKNRYPNYVMGTDYAQPWQRNNFLPMQAITNGVAVFQLHMVNVQTGVQVQIFNFATVAGPVNPPAFLQEVLMDLRDETAYPAGEYWFAVFVDGQYIGISEKIDLQNDHDDTFLIEFSGNQDKVDYYFSTGIKSMIRVQAQMLPPGFDMDQFVFTNDAGKSTITRAVPLESMSMIIGSKHFIVPDWMAKKINMISGLKNLYIENYKFTRNTNSKLEKYNSDYNGFPNFIYKIEMQMLESETGNAFATPGDSSQVTHVKNWLLDPTAFGKNGNLINVTAQEN